MKNSCDFLSWTLENDLHFISAGVPLSTSPARLGRTTSGLRWLMLYHVCLCLPLKTIVVPRRQMRYIVSLFSRLLTVIVFRRATRRTSSSSHDRPAGITSHDLCWPVSFKVVRRTSGDGLRWMARWVWSVRIVALPCIFLNLVFASQTSVLHWVSHCKSSTSVGIFWTVKNSHALNC